MCSDRNMVAIAIAWSARSGPAGRLEIGVGDELFSAPTQIRAIASTAFTGQLPVALSCDSITASVPSITALATSSTSARVGSGCRPSTAASASR